MILFLFTTILHAKSYEHEMSWETTPPIVVCGENSPDTKFVQESLIYWQDLGYEFGEITKKDKCPTLLETFGKIVIKNKKLVGEEGNTKVQKYHYRYDKNKSYISYAVVEINQTNLVKPNENKETLTHEIGHAIGIGHTEDSKDIMYPYVN